MLRPRIHLSTALALTFFAGVLMWLSFIPNLFHEQSAKTHWRMKVVKAEERIPYELAEWVKSVNGKDVLMYSGAEKIIPAVYAEDPVVILTDRYGFPFEAAAHRFPPAAWRHSTFPDYQERWTFDRWGIALNVLACLAILAFLAFACEQLPGRLTWIFRRR